MEKLLDFINQFCKEHLMDDTKAIELTVEKTRYLNGYSITFIQYDDNNDKYGNSINLSDIDISHLLRSKE